MLTFETKTVNVHVPCLRDKSPQQKVDAIKRAFQRHETHGWRATFYHVFGGSQKKQFKTGSGRWDVQFNRHLDENGAPVSPCQEEDFDLPWNTILHNIDHLIN
jgi:hypothetical protein